MTTGTEYSPRIRREYIDQQLNTMYGWEGYDQVRGAWSYRKIASDIGLRFNRKPVSPATVQSDIQWLRERAQNAAKKRAAGLLDPADFRSWRAYHFKDTLGRPYETPDHQYHWFRVMMSLALKEAIPDDTLEFLDIPKEFNDDILGRKKLLTLILLAPPRHGKTELAIHAIIWLICYNPNIRILYCSGILTTSQDNADYIKQELEFNETLIDNYGPFRTEDVVWNQKQFVVATRTIRTKTATVLTLGRGSNPLSKDADLIVVDDPQDLDAAESETTTARDFKWFTTQLMSRREPHTPVLGLGSHLPTLYGDLWTQIENSLEEVRQEGQVVLIKKIKAHDYTKCDLVNDVDEDGKPAHTVCLLWPSLRPYWFLEAQRASLADDVLFEAVYNQELLNEQLDFFPKDIINGLYIYPEPHYVGTGQYGELDLKLHDPGILDDQRSWRTPVKCCNRDGGILYALGIDPGMSDSKSSSESAFALGGVCVHCHRIYLIDVEHVRQSPELNPHTALKFLESYPEISRIRIEINAYQKALARDPLLVDAQMTHRFLLEEWRTDERKNDPRIGIPILSRWMKSGKFSMPYKSMFDKDLSDYIRRQFLRWPKAPNDIVMAIWLMELSLADLYEQAQYVEPINTPSSVGIPPYLLERTVTIDLGEIRE